MTAYWRSWQVTLRGVFAGFWAATGFLTVVPVPARAAASGHAWSTIFFPLVGLALGVSTAAVIWVPLADPAPAILALTILFLLTGGLHWDGCADVLDATVTPGLSRERRLTILRDPCIGAHAAVGVSLIVVLSAFALTRAPSWGIVLGPVVGRWSMVATLRWAAPLNPTGTGALLRDDARPVAAALTPLIVFAVLVRLGVPAVPVALAVGAGVLASAFACAWTVKKLGGMNGDAHGAAGLLAEAATWMTAASFPGVVA